MRPTPSWPTRAVRSCSPSSGTSSGWRTGSRSSGRRPRSSSATRPCRPHRRSERSRNSGERRWSSRERRSSGGRPPKQAHDEHARMDTPLTRRSMPLLEARRMLDEAVRAFVQAVTTPPAANEGTVVGGIGASLAVLFGAGAARLWVAVLVLMLMDLVAGLLRALVGTDEEVCGAAFLGGFLGKL